MTPSLPNPFRKTHPLEVDLHMHSLHSDGSEAPGELVRRALELGLKAIALTDHDTVAGYEEAWGAAVGTELEVVRGVELSASEGRSDVHLLMFDYSSEPSALETELLRFRVARERRAVEMVSRLNALGVDVSMDDVRSLSGPGAIGRPHVAGALILRGIVTTNDEAFRKYLGHGGPAFVPKEKLSLEEAMAFGQRHGGRVVLAHPGSLRRDDLIPRLKELGAVGLEVWHPKHDADASRHYLALARSMALVPTGGSDYHGSRNPGQSMGSSHVPASALEELRAARVI